MTFMIASPGFSVYQ